MGIDPNFEMIVRQTQQQLENVGKGIRADGQRPWLDFKDLMVIGKFEYEKFHDLFDRSKGNEEYVQLRGQKDAQIKELQTAKISVDFLAGMERDFRMRHRSRIRSCIHAGNRASALGQDNGPLRKNTIDWLGSLTKEVGQPAEGE